ncbi:MFS transporter [Streptomyces sp. NA02950]|uniref:MFS transporter n=1 Tax=Streptomyces sp. NA02950 TaxID=2742137 RepID=UPI00158FE7AA|nr:MFS transporter [Streptomyces sp. NA02950]QKV96398.1 MFS transporter [Streptomyces sp. NA02950]
MSAGTKAARTLRSRPAITYMSGEFLSQSGTYLSVTAQAWVVLEAGHQPLALGVLMAARYAPAALLGPAIGKYVDSRDPRRLVLLANYAQSLLALAVMALAFTPGSLLFVPFVIAGSASQVFAMLEHAGRMAYVAAIVPDEARARFAGATSSASTLGRIVGPAFASVILTFGPSGLCFAVDALTFVLAALLLPRPRYEVRIAGPSPLREGFRYIWSLPAVRDLLIIFSLVSLVSFNVATMVPLVVREDYHNDPWVLAAFNIAFGIGSFLGGAVRAWLRTSAATSAFLGLLLFGSAFVALGLTPSLAVVPALLFAGGFGRLMFTASSEAVLAVGVSQERRGLVGSLYAVAFTGTTPLGAILVTSLSGNVGTSPTLVMCGLAAIAGGAAYAVSLAVHRRRGGTATADEPASRRAETEPR